VEKVVALRRLSYSGWRIGRELGLNEEELEAMQLSGVKYVVIQAPDNMMNPSVVDADAPKEPLKPSFIDAEVVTREE
jgi:hypothetical protein